MIKTKGIEEQLADIYYNHEWWHKEKIPREELKKYNNRLLDNKNIIYYEENGEVLGYVEFWRINFSQFGRLVCHEPFHAYLENITDGNIAYVANTWIHPKHRRSKVTKWLKLMFFKHNYHCEYFVGEALRKRTQPIKVFRKDKLRGRNMY